LGTKQAELLKPAPSVSVMWKKWDKEKMGGTPANHATRWNCLEINCLVEFTKTNLRGNSRGHQQMEKPNSLRLEIKNI
jgi:hypothetical protein